MKTILVTGGNGQLGQSIKSLEGKLGNGNTYVYLDSNKLDITDESQIDAAIATHKPAYIVNCAAYTAVDKSESESDKAYVINAQGPRYLALKAKEQSIILIHISTDFVFGETAPVPLTENMEAKPTGVYGASKLAGEKLIAENMNDYFIVRTSWLYSEFQNNFLKTMLRLGNEREELSVVFDQVGTPTYAVDLAGLIFHIINSGSSSYGVYHYSNEGVTSWYDFAYEIFSKSNTKINLKPITSDKFPTLAKRPNYSVMSKEKVKQSFGIEIQHWTQSVAACLKQI